MPAYIIRHAGTNICAPNRRELTFLIDERTGPSNYECAVIPYGFGIEFYKKGRPLNLVIGNLEGSEQLEEAASIYVTEDLFDCL